MLEVVFEGIKKFGAEVISAVLFTVVLWGYKRSRTFLKQYNRMKQEVAALRDEVRRLEGALNDSEAQKSQEARLKEDVQRQLEAESRAHDKTKAELQSVNEALREANAKSAELQRQLESKRQEQERLNREAKADYELGMKYYNDKDYQHALGCFHIAAEMGHTEAQNMLGTMFFESKTLKQYYVDYRDARQSLINFNSQRRHNPCTKYSYATQPS